MVTAGLTSYSCSTNKTLDRISVTLLGSVTFSVLGKVPNRVLSSEGDRSCVGSRRSWRDWCRFGVLKGDPDSIFSRIDPNMLEGEPCSGVMVEPFAKTAEALGKIVPRCFRFAKDRNSAHSPSNRMSSKSSRVS